MCHKRFVLLIHSAQHKKVKKITLNTLERYCNQEQLTQLKQFKQQYANHAIRCNLKCNLIQYEASAFVCSDRSSLCYHSPQEISAGRKNFLLFFHSAHATLLLWFAINPTKNQTTKQYTSDQRKLTVSYCTSYCHSGQTIINNFLFCEVKCICMD